MATSRDGSYQLADLEQALQQLQANGPMNVQMPSGQRQEVMSSLRACVADAHRQGLRGNDRYSILPYGDRLTAFMLMYTPNGVVIVAEPGIRACATRERKCGKCHKSKKDCCCKRRRHKKRCSSSSSSSSSSCSSSSSSSSSCKPCNKKRRRHHKKRCSSSSSSSSSCSSSSSSSSSETCGCGGNGYSRKWAHRAH